MSSKTHMQCSIRRGHWRDTVWLPKRYCVVGKSIRIGAEEGWFVTSVGDIALPSSYVAERGRDWKHTRQASDI